MPAHFADFVAYYRVSTDKQGESGLGLEAQKAAVERYLNGGTWKLLKEFTEIESGKRHENRPKFAEALALCRKKRATLIIAKLDRLSRNVAFIATLLDSNVRIKCADMPDADRTFLQMLAVFAEHERRRISERTKEALAAAKDRGVVLGNPRLKETVGTKGAEANARKAAAVAANVLPIIHKIEAQARGPVSLRQIAAELTARKIKTPGGGDEWNPVTVSKIKRRGLNQEQAS
jgi:DNA invertase Pin-like site-specific DNA recombinase